MIRILSIESTGMSFISSKTSTPRDFLKENDRDLAFQKPAPRSVKIRRASTSSSSPARNMSEAEAQLTRPRMTGTLARRESDPGHRDDPAKIRQSTPFSRSTRKRRPYDYLSIDETEQDRWEAYMISTAIHDLSSIKFGHKRMRAEPPGQAKGNEEVRPNPPELVELSDSSGQDVSVADSNESASNLSTSETNSTSSHDHREDNPSGAPTPSTSKAMVIINKTSTNQPEVVIHPDNLKREVKLEPKSPNPKQAGTPVKRGANTNSENTELNVTPDLTHDSKVPNIAPKSRSKAKPSEGKMVVDLEGDKDKRTEARDILKQFLQKCRSAGKALPDETLTLTKLIEMAKKDKTTLVNLGDAYKKAVQHAHRKPFNGGLECAKSLVEGWIEDGNRKTMSFHGLEKTYLIGMGPEQRQRLKHLTSSIVLIAEHLLGVTLIGWYKKAHGLGVETIHNQSARVHEASVRVDEAFTGNALEAQTKDKARASAMCTQNTEIFDEQVRGWERTETALTDSLRHAIMGTVPETHGIKYLARMTKPGDRDSVLIYMPMVHLLQLPKDTVIVEDEQDDRGIPPVHVDFAEPDDPVPPISIGEKKLMVPLTDVFPGSNLRGTITFRGPPDALIHKSTRPLMSNRVISRNFEFEAIETDNENNDQTVTARSKFGSAVYRVVDATSIKNMISHEGEIDRHVSDTDHDSDELDFEEPADDENVMDDDEDHDNSSSRMIETLQRVNDEQEDEESHDASTDRRSSLRGNRARGSPPESPGQEG